MEEARHDGPDAWFCGVSHAFLAEGAGPVLDVACGDGRNALWLSATGVAVLGVDRSAARVARAGNEALNRGLSAEFKVTDLELDALPEGPWGGVVVIHYLDRALCGALAEALRPGGLLAYKTHLAHPLRGSSRPRRQEYLLGSGELLSLFGGLSPLRYAEWAASGEAFAALLARKPGGPVSPPPPRAAPPGPPP